MQKYSSWSQSLHPPHLPVLGNDYTKEIRWTGTVKPDNCLLDQIPLRKYLHTLKLKLFSILRSVSKFRNGWELSYVHSNPYGYILCNMTLYIRNVCETKNICMHKIKGVEIVLFVIYFEEKQSKHPCQKLILASYLTKIREQYILSLKFSAIFGLTSRMQHIFVFIFFFPPFYFK